ncbi:MAG TPA: hypothetical protein VFX30_14325 [bacterium]|nr:hypothetical protein [bacterium]
MSQMPTTVRSEESRSEAVPEWEPHVIVTPEGAGVRIEEIGPEPVCLPKAYGNLMRLVDGRSGTVCVPLSSSGDIPSPAESSCTGGLPTDQLQTLWNQVLADSTRQVANQTADQAKRASEEKTKKLEKLLRMALASGDIDTAMLLFSGLESRQANQLAASLMNRMQELQKQRQGLTANLTQSQSGDQKQDAQSAANINSQVGDISTELNMLQTFLQDVTERKNETQQLASNFLKSRHDTALSIIRNMS